MDRIFYKTDVPESVYIFDTSFLPSPDIINYDEFILTLMTFVPSEPYTLIMFCSGLNKISWIYGIKFLKKFLTDDTNLANIQQVISVHEGWFIKTLTSILANYNLTKKNMNMLNNLLDFKFPTEDSDQFINCSSLEELNAIYDITTLKISLNIYKVDYQLNNPLIASNSFPESLNHHVYQIYNILDTYGDKAELIFHKPGNKLSSEIFMDCIKRNQLIFINDWNLYCIATCFKKLIQSFPVTLIPIEMIDLPITDYSIEHNFHGVLDNLPSDYQIILINLFKLFHKLINSPVTKLNSKILSKIFTNCLTHEPHSKTNEANIVICNNFIKKVIDKWSGFSTVDMVEMGEIFNINHNDVSYIDYDMTMDTDDDSEDHHSFDISPAKGLGCGYPMANAYQMTPKKYIGSPNKSSINGPTKTTISGSPTKTTFDTGILSTNNNLLNCTNTMKSKDSNTIKPMNSMASMNSVSSIDTIKTMTPSHSPIRNEPPNNITVQYPPQKYKFQSTRDLKQVKVDVQLNRSKSVAALKKPTIRGVKVSELARLYEERAQGLEILRSL